MVRALPACAQLNLRLDPAGPGAGTVAAVLGAPLPLVPNTLSRAGDRTLVWLGPDEWLVLGPDPRSAGATEAHLRRELGGIPASVVDVSANRVALMIAGARSRDVLAHGCALDLDPTVFPVGRCAQTMLARAQVVLVHPEADMFWSLVRPSFAPYLAAWLADAAAEYRQP